MMLQQALIVRAGDYSAAIDRIRLEVEERPAALDAVNELREAVELVHCLRRLLDGRTVFEIHDAFGAPGDFGYDTPIGDSLSKLYRGEVSQ